MGQAHRCRELQIETGREVFDEGERVIRTQVLREFELFDGLQDDELHRIAELCHERTLEEGAYCFMQGKKAADLHLCCDGKVDIVVQLREPWGIAVTIHTAKRGEVFGWSALVEPRIYTASAKCLERTKEICIRGADFLSLFDQNLHIGYVLMRNLSTVVSSRLTESRQKLARELAAGISREAEY